MNKLNTYLIHRPYCTPRQLVVLAETKKEAIKLTHQQCGYADGTTAKKQTNKGIVLIKPAGC